MNFNSKIDIIKHRATTKNIQELKTLMKENHNYLPLIVEVMPRNLWSSKSNVLDFIDINIKLFQYAATAIKKDKEFLLRNPKILEHCFDDIDKSLKDDFEIAQIAIELNGSNFLCVSKRLQNNKELAYCAFVKDRHSVINSTDEVLSIIDSKGLIGLEEAAREEKIRRLHEDLNKDIKPQELGFSPIQINKKTKI